MKTAKLIIIDLFGAGNAESISLSQDDLGHHNISKDLVDGLVQGCSMLQCIRYGDTAVLH